MLCERVRLYLGSCRAPCMNTAISLTASNPYLVQFAPSHAP